MRGSSCPTAKSLPRRGPHEADPSHSEHPGCRGIAGNHARMLGHEPPDQQPPPSTASSGSTANPYAALASVPSLSVTSASVRDGQPFAAAQLSGIFGVPGGKDESPQLSWTAGPSGTKSYVVTMYDVDAPTGSGFWHWTVYDIPATIHQLAAGAGTPGSATLPPAQSRRLMTRACPDTSGLPHPRAPPPTTTT